ncbi:hypothetical protein BGZ52_011388, partial [Haplosporangium bisporale]
IGLAVYAYFKIQDLKSREFFLQTTEKATPEVKTIISVPMYHCLCGDHQWATIFHTNSEFVNVSQNAEGMYWFSLAPTDLNAPR